MSALTHFGKLNEIFTREKAKAKFAEEGFEALKNYLAAHFVKLESGYGRFNCDEPLIRFKTTDLSHHVGAKGEDSDFKRGEEGNKQSANCWKIISSFEPCGLTLDPCQEKVFVNKNGKTVINMFEGWKWPRHSHHVAPSPEEMKLIQPLLDHVFVVYANKDSVVYEKIMRVYARVAQQQKGNLAVLCVGAAGAGKSMFSDFLRIRAFGTAAATQVEDPNQILGNFNAKLAGKCFIVLEEFQSAGAGTWLCIYNAMKTLISSDMFTLKAKYEKDVDSPNNLSFHANANHEFMKFAEDDPDRRWIQCDINPCYVGNVAYFEKLNAWKTDTALGERMGEIMWRYLRSIDVSKLDTLPPMTKKKAARQMPLIAQFFKHQIRLAVDGLGTGIIHPELMAMAEMTQATLRDKYVEWITGQNKDNKNKLKFPTPKTFSQELRKFFGLAPGCDEVGGVRYMQEKKVNGAGYATHFVLARDADEILALMKKNDWLEESDVMSEAAVEERKAAAVLVAKAPTKAPAIKQYPQPAPAADAKEAKKPTPAKAPPKPAPAKTAAPKAATVDTKHVETKKQPAKPAPAPAKVAPPPKAAAAPTPVIFKPCTSIDVDEEEKKLTKPLPVTYIGPTRKARGAVKAK